MKKERKQGFFPSVERDLYREKLDRDRRALLARLGEEGEVDLHRKLSSCGEESVIICSGCHGRRDVKVRCRATWCPSCQPGIAAQRKAELQPHVNKMQWPLFVTLTCANTPTAEGVREVVKAFGRLRRKKIWTARVVGGIACYEITNKGNGFHPHVHMVVDCEWLAIKTPPPRRGCPRVEVERLCEEAQKELCVEWGKCMKAPGMAWVWVTRANKETILNEVSKYAVKGSDLLGCEGSAGDLIRAIKATRMMTTWGKVYKRGPKEKKEARPCPMCGEVHGMLPEKVLAGQELTKHAWSKGKKRR
jgi:Replication protein